MVRNNIEIDVKTKCIEEGKTQVVVAKEIDTTKAYVNRVIKRSDGVVNKTFIKMMEALGYDIELHYVKRRK
jgi:plasmid maintenance system antidote protein VapI